MFAACGDGANHATDAAIDSTIDASCAAPARICGAACSDPRTDEMHCGDCTTACTTSQVCLDSRCAAPASCTELAQNPSATSGAYTRASDGHLFFCDLRGPVVQYDELATAPYNSSRAGYTVITGTSLQDPVVQAAFRALFNHQLGIVALETWTIGNICLTTSSAGGVRMELQTPDGPYLVLLAAFDGFGATPEQGMKYTIKAGVEVTDIAPLPLPADYFTANAPSDVTGVCGNNNNAALFFRRE
jgi:hypothetical protein